jgi:ubiquinol-cytochrome c reductase cytochrome b subunit
VKRLTALVADWLDDRTGFRALRRHALDEPLPPGTGWWFTLGSLLLFGLTVQVVTGIALALFYAPTPDHAWQSVQYIDTSVRGGSFLRGLHHWGASLVVIAAFLHLCRVVVFGSYRKPREINWIVGLVLLLIILAFGLTGYLLPWDQRAYWATVVAINISRLTPGVGEMVATFLRGGPDIGALTLTRWYAAHVLVLPASIVVLVAGHLYLMRRHGISGPATPQPGRSEMFHPHQTARDLTVSLIAGVLLAVLAWKGAPALEPPADPTSSDYVPRPDWYFFGLFQLLKYFPGKLEVIGALVIPGVVMTLLALLPWLDRGRSRLVKHRLSVLLPFAAGVAGLVTLTVLGAIDKPPQTAAGVWNIRQIGGMATIQTEERCVRCHRPDGLAGPIEARSISRPLDWLEMHVADPIVLAPGLRDAPQTNIGETRAILSALQRLRHSAPPPLDAETTHIYKLLSSHCLNCHLIDGVGGKEGPELTTVGKKLDVSTIEQRIIDPTMLDPIAEMPAFGEKLSPDDIKLLAAWLAKRK